MFRRVEAQMVLAGFNKKELANTVGIRYNTLLSKLSGATSFTLDEALLIKEAIGWGDTVEMLFERAA